MLLVIMILPGLFAQAAVGSQAEITAISKNEAWLLVLPVMLPWVFLVLGGLRSIAAENVIASVEETAPALNMADFNGMVANLSPSELDFEIIQEAIIDGSRRAFIDIYRHYEGKVRYGVARAALKSGRSHDMDDLIQEVWCRMMGNQRRVLSYYDPDRGRFGPYISWVAYQQALYVIHRERRKAPVDELPSEDEALLDEGSIHFVAQVIQSDLFQRLLAKVDAELAVEDRVLLREHYLAERILREIAVELGVTEDTIYQRNRRLKKRLLLISAQLKPRPPRTGPSAPITTRALMLAMIMQLCEGEHENPLDGDVLGEDPWHKLATGGLTPAQATQMRRHIEPMEQIETKLALFSPTSEEANTRRLDLLLDRFLAPSPDERAHRSVVDDLSSADPDEIA
ncbi:MAG: sigma-70 family RNA polymerase sigma factor [Myxococcota bacterium]